MAGHKLELRKAFLRLASQRLKEVLIKLTHVAKDLQKHRADMLSLQAKAFKSTVQNFHFFVMGAAQARSAQIKVYAMREIFGRIGKARDWGPEGYQKL